MIDFIIDVIVLVTE